MSTLQLAGQSFTLGWKPGPDFMAAQPAATVWTMVGLAFGTLLLAAFVRSLQNFRERAEALAAERTRELRDEMTRRETADRTLTALSTLQSAILTSASTAIISTTPEGLIQVFNPAAERLLGYTAEEIVGRQSPALFHEPAEVVARAAALSAELGCTVEPGFDVFVIKACRGLPNEYEWTYVRRDGARVPVLLTVTALRNEAGEFTGFLGMAVDISARQKADENLRQERHLLRTLIDNVPTAIFVKDRAGRYLISNRAHADSLGAASTAEVVGKTMDDYYPPESNGTFADSDHAVMETGQAYFEIEERERRVGKSGHFAVTKVALRDAHGTVIGLVGIKHDITALKANEAALLAARRAAEAASVAKSEFLATMSHEIRTPMNAVVGFTELLMDTPLEAEQRNYIEIIRASGQNLIALINDILDFSKIEAGKLEVDHVRFDGIDVVESVAKTLALQAKSKGLWLRFMSSPQTPRILVGDTGRLRQVLINLVGNALKFTATGGVTLGVSETTTALGLPMLRISVTDTGIGISAEKQSKLFDKFAQADSSVTREFGGNGLGLAISKRLVELMGGTIGLTSAADTGSTFWCELPLSIVQADLPGKRTVPAPAPVAAGTSSPPLHRRVLVVDDNRLNQLLVKTFLAKLGCDAVPAANGIEALHLTQAEVFDFVLMDHQMPVMDGCEATKAIRAWERAEGRTVRLPIIALTANASETGEAFYREAGMDAYLTKPLLLPQLKQAIESIDAARQAAAELTPVPPEHLVNYERALALADQDRSLLGLLASAFFAQSDELMTALRLAIGARDGPALRAQAHKLKGAVGCFAADTLVAAAQALETVPNDPDWTRLDTQGARLEAHVQQLRRELAALPQSPPQTPA